MNEQNGKIFDVTNVKQEAQRIIDALNKIAPWVIVRTSDLGGAEHVSMIIRVSLDKKETWINGILENSRNYMMSLDCHGVLKQFLCSPRELQNFRKRTVKSVDDAIIKLVDYTKKII